jgi:hypothetical protein
MPEWSVTVTDSEGPLSGFPLIAKQGRQTLAEKRTGENGSANFLLRKVNFETGPFSLTVIPNLPLAFIKASGLSQGIEITYKVKRSRCEVRLECNQIANLCNAFEKNLNQKSIFAVDDPKAPKLSVGFTASEKNSLGTGNNAMRSYEITLSVKGDGVSYMATSKGVGKSDLDATIKAVQKTDLSDLQKQLTKYCK